MHHYPKLVVKKAAAKQPASIAIKIGNHIIEKEIN